MPESLMPDEELVLHLRHTGFTLAQIADILNRPLNWVFRHVNGAYAPTRRISGNAEYYFQREVVQPALEALGHINIRHSAQVHGALRQYVDIMSETPDGTLCITEAKIKANQHELHTAIGQIILYQIALGTEHTLFQIAFPDSARTRITAPLCEALQTKCRIEILFCPKKEI